jgi:hypothetical protein
MSPTHTKFIALTLAGLLAFTSPPAVAQKEVANPADPWVHAATGTRFPAQLVGFERRQVYEYADDGLDASVSYFMLKGDAWVTVTLYVYPAFAEFECSDTYEDAKLSIQAYAGAQLVSESIEPAPAGRGGPAALHARYQIPAGSMAPDIPESRSDLYLYCPAGDQWLVKYRATWRSTADFSGEVDQLLNAIRWPGNLGG